MRIYTRILSQRVAVNFVVVIIVMEDIVQEGIVWIIVPSLALSVIKR